VNFGVLAQVVAPGEPFAAFAANERLKTSKINETRKDPRLTTPSSFGQGTNSRCRIHITYVCLPRHLKHFVVRVHDAQESSH
jgi:hypothetical protein